MFLPNMTHQFPGWATGSVKKPIGRFLRGRIKYRSSYWPAELYPSVTDVTLQLNDEVEVLGRRGIVLLVAPCDLAPHAATDATLQPQP
jgi:hypothetical protein